MTASYAGETWITVDDAAKRLRVDPARLHKRIGSKGVGRIEGRTFTIGEKSTPHIREADVERMAHEGLPHPDWEAHEDGSLIQVPDEWLIVDRPNSAHGPSGFVALQPMTVGPHPGRHIQAGDILAAGEDAAINLDTVAELPLDRGVLGLIRRAIADKAGS